MPEVILSPQAQPPRYGFLASVKDSTDNDPNFRMALIDEFAFLPETCGAGAAFAVNCEGGSASLAMPTQAAVVLGHGFVVWAAEKCSTLGSGNRDFAGIARRRLVATESFNIAAEVWSGSIAIAQGYSNRPLTSVQSDTLTNGAASVVGALAAVEQALATLGQGRPGLIHCTVQVLTHLAASFAIQKMGNLWLTATGNIVVSDAGYDGSGPGGVAAGASQWMYGTSLMTVKLGPPDVTPNEPWVEVLTNDKFIVATRPVAVVWDKCVHVAAQVDLPIGLIGGVS